MKLVSALRQGWRGSRRRFLQSLGLASAGLALWPLMRASASETKDLTPSGESLGKRRVVIYQDKAHFDERESLPAYQAPRRPAESTRRYVASMDPERFASRHWFV